MSFTYKALLAILLIVVGLWVVLTLSLSIYDHQTRTELSSSCARELSPGAPKAAMEFFMRKHTIGYGVDDQINFQYAGRIKQRKIDELLFDRKVTVALKFNAITKQYERCVVLVHYTFL